jgi:hypothetical protein
MGILRWLRGGDENGAAASVMSAGFAEMDALFRPNHHKQTEHIEESKRLRVDVANGAGIDLDRNIAVLRSKKADAAPAIGQAPEEPAGSAGEPLVGTHEVADGDGDELHRDGGDQQPGDPGQHLDPALPQ